MFTLLKRTYGNGIEPLSSEAINSVTGFGHAWPSVDSSRLWFVAIYGASVRNRADIHPCGFLLLLCEEVRSVSRILSLVYCYFGEIV